MSEVAGDELFGDLAAGAEGFELPGDERFKQIGEEADAGERVRDEQGRFVKVEQEGSAEPEVAAEPGEEQVVPEETAAEETTPVAAEEKFQSLLAKYGGDVEKALAAADEAQRLIGQQAHELGQWRAWAEQQQAAEAEQPDLSGYDSWEEAIAQDPATATEAAWRSGNQAAYYEAARAWHEMSPGAPALWAQNKQNEAQLASLNAQVASTVESTDRQTVARGVAELIQKYPDFGDYVEKIVQETAPQYPAIMQVAANGPADQRVKALEGLYLITRGLTTDTLASTAEEIARRQTEEEQQVRNEAAVVSASRTNVETPLGPAEAIGAEWAEDDAHWKDGWNV